MSKFLLTVCALGLLSSSAFAQEKSPEQMLEKQQLARVVTSGTNQRIGFFYAVNPDAPPVVMSMFVSRNNQNTAQSRLQLQPISPPSQKKTCARGAIIARFVGCRLITSRRRNTSAPIHSTCSSSSQADLAKKLIST
jgi:hypothetical protein